MKVRTSYFYQIRNFKRNMIPISTAIWDPAWYHDFTKNYSYIFYDKRKILNGIRILPIIECGKQASECHGPEQCSDELRPPQCKFLQTYRDNLEQLDFNNLIKDLEDLEKQYQQNENINEEITMVLMVYETPSNPCSERKVLIDYFNEHGIECKELEYPIQKLEIKKGDFSF